MMLKVFKQARAALSLLSADEIHRKAEQPLHIGLVADSVSAYAEMEDFLTPAGMPREAFGRQMYQVHRADDVEPRNTVDLVLYESGLPCPQGAYSFHRDDPSATVAEILHDKDDLALALGRQFPAFRHAVLEDIIHAVARENALFSLTTALPNVIPNFIELPWAFGEFASDTAFLTANQVRMAFQIAAACGKEVGFGNQKGEILTIVAGAFGWRAIARELVGHIPLGGGLIPKGAIAYAGTYVVGKGLEYLHQGHGLPNADHRKDMYREGLKRGKLVAEKLRLKLKPA